MIGVGIIGGSGYTGGELARLLYNHPEMEVRAMTSRRRAGVKVSKEMPFLDGFVDLRFVESIEDTDDLDLVFVATPYGASMDVTPGLLDAGVKVVDLSGDYRLHDTSLYSKWYGIEHRDEAHLKDSVYGIPELFRDEIRGADLVANPGCYPTAALMSLAPLFAKDLVDARVIVDAKSGTSGSGMKLTEITHHPVCGSSLIPYRIGCHRHQPEIEVFLSQLGSESPSVIFTPHLAPLIRGIVTTSYVRLKEPMEHEEVYGLFTEFYEGERFIRVSNNTSMRSVAGSNFCEIGYGLAGPQDLVVIGTIDNLVKGASGQAVQNANVMCGIEETAGLDFPGLGV